jgi:ATP phosphoribosyltransferase regulatory subunit
VMCRALDATGLREYRIALGDASLYPALLRSFELGEEATERLMAELVSRDFVGLEREARALGLSAADTALLMDVPQLRGGPSVLDAAAGPAADAAAGLRKVLELLDANVADRIIFDLGLSRGLGYYTGAVFDVLDPSLGTPIGGGGRYDDLLGRFGRPLPAVGFALGVDQLHSALAGEGT